jgi:putative transposase
MFAIKRELKLNQVETSLMRGCAGFKRFVYNFGLELLTQSWQFEEIKASDNKRIDAIKKILTGMMNQPQYQWMKKYPSTVYQSAFIDLKEAFSRWRKEISGFPRKKSKKKGDSFTVYKTSGVYPDKGQPAKPFTNRVVIESGKKIKLPGLQTFRLREKIDFICSSQTFTVSRTADRWFVSFALDIEKIPPIIHPVPRAGIDLGVKCLATVSDGTNYFMPNSTKVAKTKLSRRQWHNRHKVKGNRKTGTRQSNNAKKAALKVSRLHARIGNIRSDVIQKMTTDISKRIYRIRIEDLNVKGMIANHKLAEAVSNNCFYEIRRQLTYKQLMFGTVLEIVDRWYPSSKTCCQCGHIQPMLLSERIFNCGNCGQVIDRDLNASLNLERAPDELVRSARAELTPVDKQEPTLLDEAGSRPFKSNLD